MRRFAPQASGRRRLAAQARLRLAQEDPDAILPKA
jgi:hypothetical protein